MKPLVMVDHFAGAGGTSTGAIRALEKLSRPYKLLAINHWDEALATHKLNHPTVFHIREDLGAIDPREAMDRFDLGRTVDVLWSSPECTEHSYSRGGLPISGQSRATAWYSLKWCDHLNVKKLIIENVPSFRAWGPTDANGKRIERLKGQTFLAYLAMLRGQGYTVEHKVLNAADYGAAQTRKRLFIIATKGIKIRPAWPPPTHQKPGKHTGNLFDLPAWRTAREDVIDWSIQGKSIFNRPKPHAQKTLERIIKGGEIHWKALLPYMPILRRHLLARGVNEPVPTLAAGGNHIGLAVPELVEPMLIQVAHGDNKPGSGRGNGGRARSVDGPMGTVAGDKPQDGVAEAIVVSVAHGDMSGRVRGVDDALMTLSGSRELYLAEPVVMANRTHNAPKSVDEPTPCLNTGGSLALVVPEAFTLPSNSPFGQVLAHTVGEPMRTITTKNRPTLIEAKVHEKPYLIAFNGEREGQEPRTHSVDEPMPTICNGNKGLVDGAVLLKYSRTGGARDTDRPLDTLTAKPRYGLITPEAAQALDALPIGSITKLGIKVAADLYLDILFRMLRVHELARAQGLPRDYKFKGTVEDQVKQVGNAVHADIAFALVYANVKAATA